MSTVEERMINAIEELEQENRLLRARNTRLEAEAKVVSMQEPVAWAKQTDKKLRITHMNMQGEDGWRPLGYSDITPPAQPAPVCHACESIEWEGKPCQICQPIQPEQEPSQWRDMVVVSLVREGINKHKARELAEHFWRNDANGRSQT